MDAVLKLIFPWHLPSSTEEKLTEKIMLKKKEKLQEDTQEGAFRSKVKEFCATGSLPIFRSQG